MKARVFAIFIAAASMAQAQEQIEFEFDAPVLSRFVWRGLNVVDQPVFQPSLTASRSAWSLGFWGNFERDGGSKLTEFDTTLSYNESRGDWDFETGIVRYDFPNTGYTSTSELFGSATLNGEWSPSVALFADFDLADGAYLRLGLDRCWCPSKANEFGIGFGVGFGSRSYNDFYYGSDAVGPVDVEALLSYTRQMGDATSFNIYGGFSSLLDKRLAAGNGRRDNVFVGAGMTVRF